MGDNHPRLAQTHLPPPPADPELDLPDLSLQKNEGRKAESLIFEAEEAFSNEVRVSQTSGGS